MRKAVYKSMKRRVDKLLHFTLFPLEILSHILNSRTVHQSDFSKTQYSKTGCILYSEEYGITYIIGKEWKSD